MTRETMHELCSTGSGFFDPTMGEVLLKLENEQENEQQKQKEAKRRDKGWTDMLTSGNYKSYSPSKSRVVAA